MATANSATRDATPPASRQAQLYAKHQKIYPRDVKGIFRTAKTLSLWAMLAVFYGTPWLRWDRGAGAPDQMVLMDVDGRRGYFFNIEIWPQEVYYLTGLLVLAAIGLFFATSLFGRVWCGFACFQTVFTDLFIMAERLFEGDRNRRLALDKGAWTVDKILRKGAKHAVWLFVSALTAYSFILYFNDAFAITRNMMDGAAGPWVYGTLGGLTFTTYIFAGFAREQTCIYMCPYARFQSAMMDEYSMIVTYEAWRGEPRSNAKPGQKFEGRGHCVDCGSCYQACPTGVDIREGLQIACIGCALCVDACNNIMDRFGLPRGLITYDSEMNQVARSKGNPTTNHLLRMRTWGYVAIMTVVTGVMAYGITHRSTEHVSVIRDRAPLFVMLSEGDLRNAYTLKISNKERKDKIYELSIAGLAGATLGAVGEEESGKAMIELPARPDMVNSFRIFVTARPDILKGKSTDMAFQIKDKASGQIVSTATVFMGPGQ
ncbi:MAG: cytochrome c oxidase accessory protein CcoG [Magnetospirillum sp. WYHS-4]